MTARGTSLHSCLADLQEAWGAWHLGGTTGQQSWTVECWEVIMSCRKPLSLHQLGTNPGARARFALRTCSLCPSNLFFGRLCLLPSQRCANRDTASPGTWGAASEAVPGGGQMESKCASCHKAGFVTGPFFSLPPCPAPSPGFQGRGLTTGCLGLPGCLHLHCSPGLAWRPARLNIYPKEYSCCECVGQWEGLGARKWIHCMGHIFRAYMK